MKMKKIPKKNKNKKNKEEKEEVTKEIGTYHDFVVLDKKDKEIKIEEIQADFDSPFLKDCLILSNPFKNENEPPKTQSRFSELFKEIKENEQKMLEEEQKRAETTFIPMKKVSSYNELFGDYNLFNDLGCSTQFRESNDLLRSSSTACSSLYGNSLGDPRLGNSLLSLNSSYNRPSERISSLSESLIFDKPLELTVDINKVISLMDRRTTVMIKNIPNKFNKDMLLGIIDQNFKGTYDVFILPTDVNKCKNFGYAFINFTNSYFIPYFYFMFNRKMWSSTNSQKICEITYSKIQGKNNLFSHYPNKIIYFNEETKEVTPEQKYYIPNEYKLMFNKAFPNRFIEEYQYYFVTKVPY